MWASLRGVKVAFLARHGKDHCTPPHRINYRSNMKALQKLGVRFVYAVAAVGSCHRSYRVGDLVLPDDFIDFTSGRVSSYYDDVGSVAHVRDGVALLQLSANQTKASRQRANLHRRCRLWLHPRSSV